MKKLIKSLGRSVGLEIRRVNNKQDFSSMVQALKWLSDQGFEANTILDVGASDGAWSDLCIPFFPKATYVLFEPQPIHSEKLDKFVKSRKQTVIPIKSAVGESEGYTLFDASDPLGGALAYEESAKTIKVPLVTIDNCVSKLAIEGPYLLKLDTHGFEKSILNGAKEVLGQCNILIIEAYNFRITEEAFLFWELCTFLSEKGFSVVNLVDTLYRQHDGALWQMDLVFIRSGWQGFSCKSYS